MDRNSAKRPSALVISVVASLLLVSSSAFGADKVEKKAAGSNVKTYFPTRVKVSTPLRDHLKRPGPAAPTLKEGRDRPPTPTHAPADVPRPSDSAVKSAIHPPNMPDPIVDFEGNNQVCGCYPPDTNAAVGPDHVFEIVNLELNIFDKTGTSLTGGPVANNALWTDFGGPCETTNDGDPIVKYDQLADRWVVTQFAVEQIPYLECFAVSVTSDPLGAYFQSEYDFGTIFNDYPKLSLMPDAFYLTVRQFDSASGSAVVAFDRPAMIAGTPATAIYFDISSVYGSDTFLAADLQGNNLPSPGTPESIIGLGNPDYDGWPTSVLHFIQMTPDFADPPSTVITNFDVDVAPFVPRFAYSPQPDGYPDLEVLPFPMYTPNYRHFGGYDALVFTHDVNTPDSRVGRRWYEIRSPLSGTPTIYQQGTFAPDDGLNRWMGSAALDYAGNIAMGYSVSSSSVYPSIWYTGRLVSDPLGEMSQGEAVLINGTGSQDGGAARWGDYSSMVTDPTDQCTFWYAQEYIETTGLATWQTRLGAFKFPSCSIGPTGTLEGTVTDGTNPLAGVLVSADGATTTTNAAGFYSFTLPVETYDMEATKYGYFPGFASGIEVTDGETTVQDFVLAAAPSVTVNGVVRDGSGGGWPLYARIQVSASGYPGSTFWTDPVTGYYSVTLVEGTTFTFAINAVTPGYLTGGGTVDLTLVAPTAPFVVRNWDLTVDGVACSAPGYSPDIHGLVEDFSGGTIPAGWTVENNSGDGGLPWIVFEGGDPCGQFPGNMTGGTGPYAIVNSNCDGFVTDDTNLITPSVDMSALTAPLLRFSTDYFDCCGSTITADYTVDGGATWTNVYQKSGTSDRGPKTINAFLDAAGEPNVQARFHFDGFWAWWWQVDNVLLGEAGCLPGTGGLVVGNVYDASTGNGLNGATVENLAGGSTKTFPTPDPAQNDGFYVLYSEAGNNTFEASVALYSPDTDSALVVPGASQRLDFSLLSGNLSASPSPLNSRVNPGGTDEQTLTITNTGGADASFELVEINAPLLLSLTQGFASQSLRQAALARLPRNAKGTAESRQTSTKDLPAMPNRPAPGRVLAVGDVLSKFDSNITFGWGVATVGSNIWLSDLGVAGGDNQDHEYTPDGTQTGNTIDDSGVGEWAADGAFNPLTGNFWRVAVGGNNCIYEFSPSTLSQTGNTICGSPWAGISQRGLAYSQADDTYFIGGWNEGVVYHFDSDGNTIDSAFVGLPISGLAYNSANGHLLAISNQPSGQDVTVLDALDNYNVVGSFQVLDNGSPAFGDFAQAGLEFDCIGSLWAVNQATQVVYQIESGEGAGCEVDIPWFSVDPAEGTVPGLGGARPTGGGGNSVDVSANWDSTGLLPGLRMAQLVVKTDTPHEVPAIPVTLTVRFLDVPDSDIFEAYIYGAAGAGIMMGGPPNCPAGVLYFCPNGVVTRADMAGYIFRAAQGSQTPPPVYQNIFGDVTFNDYNSFYIQGIFDLGITAGCSPDNYCPNDPNRRNQMSVFIWKGEHGDDPPPVCTPATAVFADVPCDAFAADYIYGLYQEGVTAGCGGGNFCPNADVTNGQMSVFLVKAFNVPHL